RRIRRRLTGGKRLCACVAEHHRHADRHAPQAPTVALAYCLGVLEEFLCPLLIDLRCRRRRMPDNYRSQDCRAKHWHPHRALPVVPETRDFSLMIKLLPLVAGPENRDSLTPIQNW